MLVALHIRCYLSYYASLRCASTYQSVDCGFESHRRLSFLTRRKISRCLARVLFVFCLFALELVVSVFEGSFMFDVFFTSPKSAEISKRSTFLPFLLPAKFYSSRVLICSAINSRFVFVLIHCIWSSAIAMFFLEPFLRAKSFVPSVDLFVFSDQSNKSFCSISVFASFLSLLKIFSW